MLFLWYHFLHGPGVKQEQFEKHCSNLLDSADIYLEELPHRLIIIPQIPGVEI